MTEEIAATDAYATQAEGRVAELVQGGVVLDRTVFYARGGGQPGDTGVLRWSGGEVRVTDSFKAEGRHVHAIDGEPPSPGPRSRA